MNNDHNIHYVIIYFPLKISAFEKIYTTVTKLLIKMAKFIWVIFSCSCVDLLLDSLCIHPHWDLKVRNFMNLHFVPADKVVVKDDTWCQTLGKFIDVHFTDLNPNSYDMINLKFDLDISTNNLGLDVSIKLKWSETLFKNQSNYSFLQKILPCIFIKALTCTCIKMKSFSHEL